MTPAPMSCIAAALTGPAAADTACAEAGDSAAARASSSASRLRQRGGTRPRPAWDDWAIVERRCLWVLSAMVRAVEMGLWAEHSFDLDAPLCRTQRPSFSWAEAHNRWAMARWGVGHSA